MHTESSVVFNLAEIMQLEHERVAAERAAEQAARAALERERRERVERERGEVERAQRVQARLRLRAARRAERQEREREAALLRVRLDAEARSRQQREVLELERMRAEQAQRRQPRAWTWQRAAWMAALGVIATAGLLHVRQSASELGSVRASERAALARSDAALQESTRLRAELEAMRATRPRASGQEPGLVVAPSSAIGAGVVEPRAGARPPTAGARLRPRPNRAGGSARSPSHGTSPLLDDVDGEDDDPIGQLPIDDL